MVETVRNRLFPDYYSYQSQSGDSWSTQIVETASGTEIRNSLYANPRRVYDITLDNTHTKDMAEVRSFFNAMRGRAFSFRFRDWADYRWREDGSTDPIVIAAYTGPGNYQLTKTYSTGAFSYIRNINLPRVQAVYPEPGVLWDANHPAQNFELYLDSTLLTLNTDYTISNTTGIINIPGAIGSGTNLLAKYEYDVPVRFDTDSMEVVKLASSVETWTGVRLREVRI